MTIFAPDRRALLKILGLSAAGSLLAPTFVQAATPDDARLIVVILRGALDGLSAVPPYGDPDYARQRATLALAGPGAADGALALNGTFGLHPALKGFHASYQAGELIAFHALATPYRERSHFDAQDLLENGTPAPHGARDGWLNRALGALPKARGPAAGLAVGQNVPLILRGPVPVTSWAPAVLPAVDDDTVGRLMDLYAGDALLGPALAEAVRTDEMIAGQGDGAGEPAGGAGRNPRKLALDAARSAGTLIAAKDGPRVAVFDMSGWDTHANQGAAAGALAARLSVLDSVISTLKTSLGATWSRTAVLIVTEFGRTVAENGTRGTDHGTAAAAFLIGGAVKGGRVVTDWPGLSTASLYQGRDLRPTGDVRALAKGLLSAHLGVANTALDASVFPDSAAVRPLEDLVKT